MSWSLAGDFIPRIHNTKLHVVAVSPKLNGLSLAVMQRVFMLTSHPRDRPG
jgi:hypothetical protein